METTTAVVLGSTKDHERTCAERITDHMKSRASDFAEILARLEPRDEDGDEVTGREAEEAREEAETELWQYPLCVEVYRTVRIDLGTGGPADWLEALVDDEGDITRLTYHFADWFDHAERNVEDHGDTAPLWRFAEQFVEGALIGHSEKIKMGGSY